MLAGGRLVAPCECALCLARPLMPQRALPHQEAADAATPDAALQCYLLANSEWPQTGQHLMGAAFVCRQLGERARALRLCEAAAALATLEAQAVGVRVRVRVRVKGEG